MWLLNAYDFTLEYFEGDTSIPKYAILSHRWRDQEVSFRSIQEGTYRSKQYQQSWDKINDCCQKARLKRVEYVWIDTCCIDKSSSAELSEAINSMFKWYKRAEICLVYLFDVTSGPDFRHDFLNSEWFQRGWTLQELLAPREMEFFDRCWNSVGFKSDLVHDISLAARISEDRLTAFHAANTAERFSWISRRKTKRSEDIAYSMMGIFNVNMALLYGEGGEKAFYRLQLEIIHSHNDNSIFVWDRGSLECNPFNLLAPSAKQFANMGQINKDLTIEDGSEYVVTHLGLRIDLQLHVHSEGPWGTYYIAELNCYWAGPEGKKPISLFLLKESSEVSRFRCEDVIFRAPMLSEPEVENMWQIFIRCERPQD